MKSVLGIYSSEPITLPFLLLLFTFLFHFMLALLRYLVHTHRNQKLDGLSSDV